MDRDDPGYPGQAAYNRSMLAIYDPWVIGFMAPVVWRSPVHPTVARYRQHLGRRHLDVGPGTGYLIEKAEPAEGTEITLLDPNPKVLERSSRRLAALHPVTVEADVMKPLPLEGRFDSAALSFVLHCLRGPQEHKAVAIRNIAAVLEPDGVLFGGTVLGTEAEHSRAARGAPPVAVGRSGVGGHRRRGHRPRHARGGLRRPVRRGRGTALVPPARVRT